MKLLSLACAAMVPGVFPTASGAAESARPFLSELLQDRGLTNQTTSSIPLIMNGATNTLPLKQFVFPTNIFNVVTNGSTVVLLGTNRFSSLTDTESPPPGTYRTEPFACIVVVPEPHPDERMAVNPGKAETKMPVIEPKLKFVPLK